jgi:hypothetical protein
MTNGGGDDGDDGIVKYSSVAVSVLPVEPPTTIHQSTDYVSWLVYGIVFIVMGAMGTVVAIDQAATSYWDAIYTSSAIAMTYIVWVHSRMWQHSLRPLSFRQWVVFVVCLFGTGGLLVFGFVRLQEAHVQRTDRATWTLLAHTFWLMLMFGWCMYGSICANVVENRNSQVLGQ